MKKLMIAAAIVCAAALTQAATVSWSIDYIQKGGKNVSGVAYIFANEVVSQGTLLTALEGKGAEAVIEALSGITTKFETVADTGSVFMGSKDSKRPDNSVLGLSDSTTYNLYALVFDTDTITDESQFYLTTTQSGKTASGTNNKAYTFEDQDTYSAATGAWHAVAAPEPTSGILLLLGVAGLALRRRRD